MNLLKLILSLCCTNMETKAQREEVTCLRSHSKRGIIWHWNPLLDQDSTDSYADSLIPQNRICPSLFFKKTFIREWYQNVQLNEFSQPSTFM